VVRPGSRGPIECPRAPGQSPLSSSIRPPAVRRLPAVLFKSSFAAFSCVIRGSSFTGHSDVLLIPDTLRTFPPPGDATWCILDPTRRSWSSEYPRPGESGRGDEKPSGRGQHRPLKYRRNPAGRSVGLAPRPPPLALVPRPRPRPRPSSPVLAPRFLSEAPQARALDTSDSRGLPRRAAPNEPVAVTRHARKLFQQASYNLKLTTDCVPKLTADADADRSAITPPAWPRSR